ncbi:MAG: HYExAFE family protein [Candidatus Micrarchaeota archaeon]
MTKRKGKYSNYELAFEAFLRQHQLLYLAINEARRPIFRGRKVKNFDFIVVSKNKKLLLIDIKGKQFPYESKIGKNYWENWITKDDGVYLAQWSKVFHATALLVYVYKIKYAADEALFDDLFRFKGKKYGLAAIEIGDYLKNAKPRSGKFKAISVSREKMPLLTKPISSFLKC